MSEDTSICCPGRLSDTEVREWLRSLPRLRKQPRVAIDFSRLSFAFPYGTLLLATALRSFVEARKQDGLETVATGLQPGKAAQSYLGHIGFFHHVGLPRGNQVEQALGSDAYVPITVLARADYHDGNLNHDRIQRKAEAISGVLANDEHGSTALAYCIREVVRNVFEHSGAASCVMSAQRYKHAVEAAIVDNGVGIAATLRSTLPGATAEEAIDQAVRPGVSRVLADESDDPWANSGYGLYVLAELGTRLGSFELASSGRFLSVRSDGVSRGEVPFYGTAVKICFSFAEAEYFPNLVEQIVRAGEVAAQSKLGRPRPASASSRMRVFSGSD